MPSIDDVQPVRSMEELRAEVGRRATRVRRRDRLKVALPAAALVVLAAVGIGMMSADGTQDVRTVDQADRPSDDGSVDVEADAHVGPGPSGPSAGGNTEVDGPGGGDPDDAAPGPNSTKKAPVIIGLIGWFSGSGGETMGPVREVWQAWVKQVNARGGINGHPVQLLVGDHGGQEDRARALAQDFVENKGAIALSLAEGGPAVGEYARSKSVAVVGSVVTGSTWNTNPMLFPPFGSNEATIWGSARLMKKNGLTKIAVLVDAMTGQDGADRFRKYSGPEGVEIVYERRYLAVQADFTSECIQMREAGAMAVYPVGDVNSMERMARDCARQGYNPVWVTPVMDDGMVSNPAFEGAVLPTAVFPWFLHSGSPALEEYGQAVARYAPNRVGNGSPALSWAWVSAKLFEKAAQNVSDRPTSQDILNGLWSMKGETLGGLAPPRTFTRNQPTPETYCIYESRIRGGKWTAPQGATPICR